MDVEQALVTHILADQNLAAKIGRRIYPLKLSQDTAVPAITYQRVSTPRTLSLTGESASNPRIQLDVYADTFADAKDVAKLLYQSLDYFRGNLGGKARAAVLMADSRDDYEYETDRFRTGVDFFVMYTKQHKE